MKALIDVFRMNELSKKIRARIIIKLGRVINDEHAANITEGIVAELVNVLDPENDILKEERYNRHLKQEQTK